MSYHSPPFNPARNKLNQQYEITPMDYSPALDDSSSPPQYSPYSNIPTNQMFNEQFAPPPGYGIPSMNYAEQKAFPPQHPPPSAPPNYDPTTGFMPDPLMTNVAMHYSSKLVGTGKTMVGKELGKYVAVSRLKFYFAVDTHYVLAKLKLLLFPFTHSDWTLKFDQNEQLPPRFDVNAPDLYIPAMAYVTYVLVAGLMLGIQDRFTPEILGILASQALAWTLMEIIVQIITLYVTNIHTSLKTLDLVAFAGYKFVGIIIAVILSLMFHRKGYYLGLLYCSIALAFFIVRTLKFHVLSENPGNFDDGYSNPIKSAYTTGNKRRMYFMLSIAAIQPLLMWWLSFHLITSPVG